jgi:hypothetical protein
LILLDAIAFPDMKFRNLATCCGREKSTPASFNRSYASIGYRFLDLTFFNMNCFNINKPGPFTKEKKRGNRYKA